MALSGTGTTPDCSRWPPSGGGGSPRKPSICSVPRWDKHFTSPMVIFKPHSLNMSCWCCYCCSVSHFECTPVTMVDLYIIDSIFFFFDFNTFNLIFFLFVEVLKFKTGLRHSKMKNKKWLFVELWPDKVDVMMILIGCFRWAWPWLRLWLTLPCWSPVSGTFSMSQLQGQSNPPINSIISKTSLSSVNKNNFQLVNNILLLGQSIQLPAMQCSFWRLHEQF